MSDLTGTIVPHGERVPRGDRKDGRTVSDKVLFQSLPEEVRHIRRRQASTSDVIQKVLSIGNDHRR